MAFRPHGKHNES
ncbi:hypothetical protein CGLO_11147 [Colletotrichum gloeosporioides Cg-14]|uniref:Uncharacterized protein n=1 Tax=Colletotrichum gloeosporioides (strain Cg-14) TaxID=1237896 RepID=T0K8Y3_COLGC|nr:hypothetical protein CGLO_11147 [Colletotrichum gloeosporioides Cg-14]